jgi:hypothetical protein
MDRQQNIVFEDAVKEGYLTKKGKKFKGWKRRYFVLRGERLEYFESQEDAAAASIALASMHGKSTSQASSNSTIKALMGVQPLGYIHLRGARVAKQKSQPNQQNDSESTSEYRHAIMITEQLTANNNEGTNSNTLRRSILCAESDIERDDWVFYIARHIEILRLNALEDNPTVQLNRTPSAPVLALSSVSQRQSKQETVEDVQKIETMVAPSSVIPTLPEPTPVPSSTATRQSKVLDWMRQSMQASSSETLNQTQAVQSKSKNVFGARIEDAIAFARIKEGYELPAVVYRCIEFLEKKNAFLEEGIYRLSGRSADIQYLRGRFERGKP